MLWFRHFTRLISANFSFTLSFYQCVYTHFFHDQYWRFRGLSLFEVICFSSYLTNLLNRLKDACILHWLDAFLFVIPAWLAIFLLVLYCHLICFPKLKVYLSFHCFTSFRFSLSSNWALFFLIAPKI